MAAVCRPDISGQKPHFVALDGLRGVAALCVVIFHFSEMVIGNYSKLWIGHGFLAVDFFFCLSGFVLGYAYDNRVAEIGLGNFFCIRLIRLQPMVVLGAVLGVIAFYANPFGVTPGYSPGGIALIFAATVFLVPYGAMGERGGNLFSLNAPSWSLLWEYIANVAFGLTLYRIRRRTLGALTLITAVVLCWAGHRAGNLSGGWSTHNFLYGGARGAFSFPAGLLVYRMRWRLRTRLGFTALSILLVLAFVMPYARGAWLREAAVIVVYFPLLIVLGAGTTIAPQTQKLCRFLGDLSYPLYMTHYAVIWIWGDYAEKHKLIAGGLWPAVALGVLMMAAFAWTAFRFYDQPVRRFLCARLPSRRRL